MATHALSPTKRCQSSRPQGLPEAVPACAAPCPAAYVSTGASVIPPITSAVRGSHQTYGSAS
eukprot:scaffold18646_cov90-Isochrysis_galbana.AAC.3